MTGTEEELRNRARWAPQQMKAKDKVTWWLVQALARMQFVLIRSLNIYVWRSSDGTIRRVEDMGERHLRNSIRLINRSADVRYFTEYERRRYARMHVALNKLQRQQLQPHEAFMPLEVEAR